MNRLLGQITAWMCIMYLYEYESHVESTIQMDFIANVCSGTGVCGFSQILGVKHCFYL